MLYFLIRCSGKLCVLPPRGSKERLGVRGTPKGVPFFVFAVLGGGGRVWENLGWLIGWLGLLCKGSLGKCGIFGRNTVHGIPRTLRHSGGWG